jgi:hypothetical protein
MLTEWTGVAASNGVIVLARMFVIIKREGLLRETKTKHILVHNITASEHLDLQALDIKSRLLLPHVRWLLLCNDSLISNLKLVLHILRAARNFLNEFSNLQNRAFEGDNVPGTMIWRGRL